MTSPNTQPSKLPVLSLSDLAHIPGSRSMPFIGNTLKVLKDPLGYAQKSNQKYGLVFRHHAFGGWNLNLLGPDANELVLFDRDKIFSSEHGWAPLLDKLFPRGLMLMDFEHHRQDRKALSVAFKPEPMKYYCTELNKGMANQVAAWSGTQFPFYPAIKKATLDLAATSFLGIDWGPEADAINRAFVDMVAASVAVVRAPLPGTAMAKGVRGRKFMLDFFAREIPARRNKQANDFFTQFCHAQREDGSLLNDDEIKDHMNFLMMAAHDTVTSSISSTVFLLAQNPEWQEKLRAEHAGLAAPDGTLSYDQLANMPITECVFKEALRIIPPVPALPRRAVKAFSFAGHDIPAGAWVTVNTLFTHRDPNIWPDPMRFDPERFLPENSKGRHKYAWVPFGGGAHMCLGLHFAYMQVKIFLFHILRQHQIVTEGAISDDWAFYPIPKPRDGLPIYLKKLDQK